MNILEAMDILGLEPGFTEKELQANWRVLAKRFHPDVNHSVGATEKFLLISAAYSLLNGRLTSPNRGVRQDWFDQMSREAHNRSKKANHNNYSDPEQSCFHGLSIDYNVILHQFVFTVAPIFVVLFVARQRPELYQQLYDLQIETAFVAGTVMGAFSQLTVALR